MKTLYLSLTDKKISGVCGGIGEYFDTDSTLIRVLWIVMTVASGIFPGILAYILAAIIMPAAPTQHHKTKSSESPDTTT